MSGKPPSKPPGTASEASEGPDEVEQRSVESPEDEEKPETSFESSAEASKTDDDEVEAEIDEMKPDDEVKEEPMEENDDGLNDSKPEESLLCDESVEDVDNDDASASDTDRKDSDEGTSVSEKRKPLQREISCEVEISQDDKSEADDRVPTRRSQRRRTAKSAAKVFDDFATKSETSEPESKPKNEDSNPEDDDVESVTSEMDSLTSESTLTTRSAHRRGGRGGPGGCRPVGRRAANKLGLQGRLKSRTGPGQSKGKSRRIIFKKSSTKAPSAVARAVTSDMVFYKGQYFTKGDVVSVTDVDGGIYYAQLRGFLTDQYCQKSCVITWLLPTTTSPEPEDGFDPATYVIGPEEEFPRKLEYFTFVMHAPDDYFYYKNAPYPTDAICSDQEYVLTRLGPKIRLVNASGKSVYTDLPPH